MNKADWQPIETAPKDRTRLLLWRGELQHGYFSPSDSDGWQGWITQAIAMGPTTMATLEQPTHWMSLPEPPG